MCVLSNQAHNTHSSVGSSDRFVSSLAALNVCSVEMSSFFEPVTEGCGASVILELRICRQYISTWSFCVSMTMAIITCVCSLLPWVQPSVGSHFLVRLHPEASTDPGPAVVLRAALSQGLQEIPLAGPMHSTTTKIRTHLKCQSEVEILLQILLMSIVRHTVHSPSRWASPLWGREPRSRTPRSTQVLWSDHIPSDRKRGGGKLGEEPQSLYTDRVDLFLIKFFNWNF